MKLYEHIYATVGTFVIGLLLALLGLILPVSCHSQKEGIYPVPHTPKDITCQEAIHVERIDTLWAYLPSQTAERDTPADSSFLATRYAVSNAWINGDGTLHHDLSNKPDAPVPAPRTATADTIRQWRYIERPVFIDVPKDVESKLTRWQSARLDTWGWLLAGLLLSVAWDFRKPLGRLFQRIIPRP